VRPSPWDFLLHLCVRFNSCCTDIKKADPLRGSTF
jgi:hypothetical protein